ncbi:hypothetical protein IFM89_015930 [Coptis chinensis]|uniref:Uncharacterized protein n=1 Tax=Coptis chinensis TaxID=261450 RepID=A0A835LRR4_9MAGN|nr:hypothetical protein IFM89_015930 [Coptis chinensis]
MEESTSMTIEFLRARLLSERSISRTARHRADELAKRVVELEEQLTHVSQQRKKAEKATAEVLAILESNGISDISEVYDSSSDQEVVVSESSDTRKEEANITTSGAGDLGVSSLVGRSLSWKSCSDGPNSVDTKRRSTSGSSTRPHIGRSCRQMKQKGARSMVAVNNETVLVESQENKVAKRSSDVSNCSSAMYEVLKESCKSEKDKVYFENLVQVLPEAQNEESTYLETANGVGGVLDALQQAKLSLKNELDRLSLSSRSGSAERRTERPASAIFAGVSMDIPVGCAGLFRVPTSSQFEALATKPNSVTPYSESESSFARFYHDLKVGTGTINRYSSSPYMDMGSLNSTYRPLITPYIDKGMGPPASSRYRYPTYADLMPRMSGRDGLPRNYPNTGLGMATNDRYSEYNDRRQSNVYNRW